MPYGALPKYLALSILAAAMASCANAPSRGGGTDAAAPSGAGAAQHAISWDAAKDHVGETVTVTGQVAGTHVSRDGDEFMLNVGRDYPDASRFVIYCPQSKGPSDLDQAYKGKTVSVRGQIVLYHNVPEIKAKAADIIVSK
jgi:hypothetical protein